MPETLRTRFAFLHLLALGALAIAQPLFDILGRYPEFLVAHGVGPGLLVLMVLMIVLAIPGALILVGWPLRAIHQGLWSIFHLFFVGLLAALFFIQVFKRGELGLTSPGVMALGLLLGGGLAAAYALWKPFRSSLTLLSATVLIFPLLFLFGSPAAGLWRVVPEKIEDVQVNKKTPVVMVVFDELPLLSLLNSRGEIDSGRFPNFARLAGNSTWFPNATAVSEGTLISVPTILDGLYPTPDNPRLPTLEDHPRNLFTLLEGTHDLHAFEFITRMAPAESRPREAMVPRMNTLFSDIALIYAHLLLPTSISAQLPPITESWKGFDTVDASVVSDASNPFDLSVPAQDWGSFQPDWSERQHQFEQFLSVLEATQRPSLYFLHSMLPHASWKYLPDGRRYVLYEKPGVAGVLGANAEGRDVNWWLEDPWLPLQAHQRHLLQVGYVDSLVGQLLDKLEATGLYDNCLLVLTSDHGTAFLPDDSRREITETNYPAILGVPLLIKMPGQRQPQVVRRNVQTVDILPTLADLLDVEFSWELDGQSAIAADWKEPAQKTAFANRRVLFQFPSDSERMGDFLERRIRDLGEGVWDPLFRIGEGDLMVGQDLAQLPASGVVGTVEIRQSAFLSKVDPNGSFVPALISGKITNLKQPRDQILRLAVAVNGRLEALTQTSLVWGDNRDFAALVPPQVLRAGTNRVDVFMVEEDGSLGLLEQERSEFQLEFSPLRLTSPDQKEIVVDTGHVVGWVLGGLTTEKDQAYLGGWAADREHLVPVESVLVFLDSSLLLRGRPFLPRSDAVSYLKSETVQNSGFLIEFPLDMLPADLSTAAIRVVALSPDGHAAELNYPRADSGGWGFQPVTKEP